MKARLIDGPVEGNELNRVVESQSAAVDPIAKDSTILKGLTLGTTSKKVAHKRNQIPQGWMAIRIRAASGSPPGYPYETEAPTKTHLTLEMAADATVDLKVW